MKARYAVECADGEVRDHADREEFPAEEIQVFFTEEEARAMSELLDHNHGPTSETKCAPHRIVVFTR